METPVFFARKVGKPVSLQDQQFLQRFLAREFPTLRPKVVLRRELGAVVVSTENPCHSPAIAGALLHHDYIVAPASGVGGVALFGMKLLLESIRRPGG